MSISSRWVALVALAALTGAAQSAFAQADTTKKATAVMAGVASGSPEGPAVPILHFSGSMRGASLAGVSDPSRWSGTVRVDPTPGRPGLYRVSIQLSSFSGNGNLTNMLQWTIAPGRCGSQIMALSPPAALPTLDMRSGGDAQLTHDGAFNLNDKGSFQLVVYQGGITQRDIKACANLKLETPKG